MPAWDDMMIDHYRALIYSMVLASAADGDMTDAELLTIGENVQLRPSAVDSVAATWAVFFIKYMFHVQLNPKGMGKMVLCP